jgi:histidine triad (HIT) family protein
MYFVSVKFKKRRPVPCSMKKAKYTEHKNTEHKNTEHKRNNMKKESNQPRNTHNTHLSPKNKREDESVDCIFCKIVKGEVPCCKIYEDKDVLVFLDIFPVHKGHTLVIPKTHYALITDVPEKEFTKLMAALHKVTAAVVKATRAEGFNIINNNSKAGHQEVPHVHFHVIPRYSDDPRLYSKDWPMKKYDDGEMEVYKQNIACVLRKVQ